MCVVMLELGELHFLVPFTMWFVIQSPHTKYVWNGEGDIRICGRINSSENCLPEKLSVKCG